MSNPEMYERSARRTIATTVRYDDAEAIVDRLADDGFPVEHVAIVGRDMHYVERVTGRLNALRAGLSGALSGLLLGLFVGVLFAFWFAHDGTSLLAVLAYWIIFGALIGAGIALLGYFLNGGRRNFSSVSGMEAERFDVLVEEPFAEDAVLRIVGAARQPHPVT